MKLLYFMAFFVLVVAAFANCPNEELRKKCEEAGNKKCPDGLRGVCISNGDCYCGRAFSINSQAPNGTKLNEEEKVYLSKQKLTLNSDLETHSIVFNKISHSIKVKG
ncbi:hypothetical protein PVAND_015479 [Polypedilum vanderplanki]|uniref:Uncharacterized protein n=1 Tax=Polypedilum vanderplanki TaxID=319348 RepID=A0A9J6BCD0_POLVA|nr:hypothetical protein PVAND_015479 [Polypedilum vanderplanki]